MGNSLFSLFLPHPTFDPSEILVGFTIKIYPGSDHWWLTISSGPGLNTLLPGLWQQLPNWFLCVYTAVSYWKAWVARWIKCVREKLEERKWRQGVRTVLYSCQKDLVKNMSNNVILKFMFPPSKWFPVLLRIKAKAFSIDYTTLHDTAPFIYLLKKVQNRESGSKSPKVKEKRKMGKSTWLFLPEKSINVNWRNPSFSYFQR